MACDKTASETSIIFSVPVIKDKTWRWLELFLTCLRGVKGEKKMLIFQFLRIPHPLLHLLLSVLIAMAKLAWKCRVKLKSKQTSQAPVLLARLRISIHLKLTSCWSVLERNIRCNQSSPPVCLLLSLICNVINGGWQADLPGLVIIDSQHEVRDVEVFIQD